jgi:tRNA pseudouridine55 synthase
VGHTGTLDPFARGLLVVLVGRATRLARFVERQDKTYAATLQLGVETDTDDRTGTVVRECRPEHWPGRQQVEEALAALVGTTLQRPPAYSAKHVDGERSYRLARRGEAVELPPVPVTVKEAALLRYAPPVVEFRVTVSAGTYVRALGRDLGTALGTGGHLTELTREAIGALSVEDPLALAEIVPGVVLRPAQQVLGHLGRRELALDEALAVRHGRALPAPQDLEGEVALLVEGELLAVARAEAGRLQPLVVLAGA